MKASLVTRLGLCTGLAFAGLTAAAGKAADPVVPAVSDNLEQLADSRQKLNVLFIAVDDLRPQLGCYGSETMISPNIDSIARDGVLFENAYCQQAVCAPSRSSLLSGLRPDTTTIHNLEVPLRKVLPNTVTLPQLFKQNGYETISIGKIYHHAQDDRQGWSDAPYRSKGNGGGYADEVSINQVKQKVAVDRKGIARGPAFESPDVPDNAYNDGKNTDYALTQIQRLKKSKQPFFLAMGFSKPHLPFNAPKKYWDLYQPEKLPLASNPFKPTNVTEYSITDFGELRTYTNIPKQGPILDELARKLIHGYHAAVSYTDAQIGRILAELETSGLRERTIVILWGDHGWKLGEHGGWCKHTNFENDTHAPLIISLPGMKNSARRTSALVEFVDIYPSLAEICGLPAPDYLEGTSFVPLLADPQRSWKQAAFSQYPRGKVMGYTMKTKEFRYTEWREKKSGKVVARELYDHRIDPAENANVVDQPKYAGDLKKLAIMLQRGWRGAVPN